MSITSYHLACVACGAGILLLVELGIGLIKDWLAIMDIIRSKRRKEDDNEDN